MLQIDRQVLLLFAVSPLVVVQLAALRRSHGSFKPMRRLHNLSCDCFLQGWFLCGESLVPLVARLRDHRGVLVDHAGHAAVEAAQLSLRHRFALLFKAIHDDTLFLLDLFVND